jgi:transposase
MKSEDLRKVVMRMTDDGMSSIQIEKQLRNVVNQRTIRRWQNLYRETGEIDLKKSAGRPKIVRTKGLIQKVKQRLVYKGRRSARKLAKSFGVSRESMRRIIKEDLNLYAYRITTEPKLTDDHKKRRVSFAYWVRKAL